MRAEPRLTRDADLAVHLASDADAEELVSALLGRGYRLAALLEHAKTKLLATCRLHTKSDLLVDLLMASTGIEGEIVEAAERIEIAPSIILPVARSGHLVAMKLLSRSPQRRRDDDDIQALMPMLDAAEKRRVASAIKLIEKRGFARGRNLTKAWAKLSKPTRRARLLR